jgi:NAD(P)-dependent dehydrogenase (short-subunit alcohol dehydrogenase family)
MNEPGTVFITGATDGLGRALADRLAADGWTLLLHGRDAAKLEGVADEIAATRDVSRPATFRADLAELAQVRRLAEDVRSHADRLEAFVSNAGVGSGEPDGRTRRTSADGYELRFAVNYLAGFSLTLGLLPLLRAAGSARIVNVASLGQHPLDFDNLMIEHDYSGTRAYGQSKLAQIMSGFHLAERLPANEITVNSLHPATYMPTKIVLSEIGHRVDALETGVEATRRLVADADVAGTTGGFFDRTRAAKANAQAYDPDAREELMSRSLALTGSRDTT